MKHTVVPDISKLRSACLKRLCINDIDYELPLMALLLVVLVAGMLFITV